MGDIVQKTTTDLSFVDGRLVPAGVIVNIDTSKVELTPENSPNLADVGSVLQPVAVAISAIGPTGPAPTMPQQVPPGVFQGVGGYHADGAVLVAEGSQAAIDALDGPTLAEVEEETPIRRGDNSQSVIEPGMDSFRSPDEPSTALTDAEREELNALRADAAARAKANEKPADGFDADAVIAGTIPDATKRLDGLTKEQLEAVRAAEVDRESPRTGMLAAIDERLGADADL